MTAATVREEGDEDEGERGALDLSETPGAVVATPPESACSDIGATTRARHLAGRTPGPAADRRSSRRPSPGGRPAWRVAPRAGNRQADAPLSTTRSVPTTAPAAGEAR